MMLYRGLTFRFSPRIAARCFSRPASAIYAFVTGRRIDTYFITSMRRIFISLCQHASCRIRDRHGALPRYRPAPPPPRDTRVRTTTLYRQRDAISDDTLPGWRIRSDIAPFLAAFASR
jgi:hypothetical protein